MQQEHTSKFMVLGKPCEISIITRTSIRHFMIISALELSILNKYGLDNILDIYIHILSQVTVLIVNFNILSWIFCFIYSGKKTLSFNSQTFNLTLCTKFYIIAKNKYVYHSLLAFEYSLSFFIIPQYILIHKLDLSSYIMILEMPLNCTFFLDIFFNEWLVG